MRKNTQNVFNAWFNGLSERNQKSIWTDGYKIYSYNTPILDYTDEGGVRIDMSRYSVTTTVHQRGTQVMCDNRHIQYILK